MWQAPSVNGGGEGVVVAGEQWPQFCCYIHILLGYNSHAIRFTLLKCTIHWVCLFPDLCIYHPYHQFRAFYHPKKILHSLCHEP